MSDTENPAKTQQSKEYASLALRISAGFCLAFWIFWDSQTTKVSSELTRDAFWIFPYVFLIVHPTRWRGVALGIALGFPLAAALLADFANGFARGREAHALYLVFACANLLLLSIAIRSWIAVRKSIRAALLLSFAATSFVYVWIIVSF
jgi:hypothetical protein